MIIIWNLFKVRARAAAVTFVCYFRDPRSLLSRERDMFRHQTAVIAIRFIARFLQIMWRVTSFQETISSRLGSEKKVDIRAIICELLGVTHDSSSIRWDINFKIHLISSYLYLPPTPCQKFIGPSTCKQKENSIVSPSDISPFALCALLKLLKLG